MKNILPVIAATLLVGCASHPSSQFPAQIKEAEQRYTTLFAAAKSAPISRDEVHRILGEPQRTGADGAEQWQVQDGRYIAGLSIRYSADGKIADIQYPGASIVSQ